SLVGDVGHRFRLADVAKGAGARLVQPGQLGGESRADAFPRPRVAAFNEPGENVIELLLKARIGPALGEVEVTKQSLQRSADVRTGGQACSVREFRFWWRPNRSRPY